jgi:hypothetical protein
MEKYEKLVVCMKKVEELGLYEAYEGEKSFVEFCEGMVAAAEEDRGGRSLRNLTQSKEGVKKMEQKKAYYSVTVKLVVSEATNILANSKEEAVRKVLEAWKTRFELVGDDKTNVELSKVEETEI